MYAAIERVAVCDLTPNQQNARTHDRRQVRQIADSIDAIGFVNPLLVDEENVLIAGHGRLEAARLLGLEEVPAIRVPNLSDPQKRALRLADNKIAENAGWDLDLLAAELADLSEIELDFDVSVTGFEVAEIDLIIGDAGDAPPDEPEVLEAPDSALPQVTVRGDLWQLGRHWVLCGDARSTADYDRLMSGDQADMGLTDPPYNVAINGHVSGNGKVCHREFAEASGEMTSEACTTFLNEAFTLSAQNSRNGAVWFAFMDWRHIAEIHAAGPQAFDEWLNLCIWSKSNAGMGSLYRSQHELIFVFRKGDEQHRNNVQLGRLGRNRRYLWTYPGVNTFRPGRMEELKAHPTAKPVALIHDAILDVSKRGDIVLDPFLGAVATLMAAEQSGRVVRGIEIDPGYVDTTLRRWRRDTGQEPVRIRDGRTLADLESDKEQEAEQ